MNKISLLALFALLAAPSAFAFTLTGSATANKNGWAGKEIVFSFNFASCAGLSADTVSAATKDAMDLWNHVADSRMTLKLGDTTTTTPAQAYGLTFTGLSAVIACDPNFSATTGQAGNSGVVGVGKSSYTAGAENFTIGSMLLNADTTASGLNNISTMTTTQLSIVIAHEMGHVLGFGHSGDPQALMYYSVGSKTSLSLSQDDLDAMAWLYGRSEPSGGVFGCGTLAVGTGKGGGPWKGIALVSLWFVLIPALATKRWKKFGRRAPAA